MLEKFSTIQWKSVCFWILKFCFKPRKLAMTDGNRQSCDALRMKWNIMKFPSIACPEALRDWPWETGALRLNFLGLNPDSSPQSHLASNSIVSRATSKLRHQIQATSKPAKIYSWNSRVISHRQTGVQACPINYLKNKTKQIRIKMAYDKHKELAMAEILLPKQVAISKKAIAVAQPGVLDRPVLLVLGL